MKKTKFHSFAHGKLAKGCKYCVKGSKMVLFATGLCPRKCYYCPISDKKYGHDVIYADEWPIKKESDMIKEAEMIDADGAGITGGDPLSKLDRSVGYIKKLKKRFGKKFHIHLYTSFDLVSQKNMQKLHKAGLDEIRFHADIDSDKLWNRIDIVREFDWDIGIEIPVIPNKLAKTKRLIDYFSDKIDFLNLNELELADNKISKLSKLGFRQKDRLSYGVKGSEKMALSLIKYIEKNYPKLNVHYCTAKLKDRVQLANRIKRRARNAAKDYDLITDEGILFRGVVYSTNISKIRKYGIKSNLIELDSKRKRILIDAQWLNKHKDKLKKEGFKIAYVWEYPTYDCLNVRTDFL